MKMNGEHSRPAPGRRGRLVPCLLAFGGGLAFAASLFAEAGDPAARGARVSITRQDDGSYVIGLVTFHPQTRAVRFPAEVNMTEGPLEFAIVHQSGKVHESLLTTRARPMHINIALKLLRFRADSEGAAGAGGEGHADAASPATSRFAIAVEWKREDGGEGKSALLDWIANPAMAESPPPDAPWIYGGSFIHEGVFQAESSGDIAALFTADSALFNYAGEGRLDDDHWSAVIERVPAVGTEVVVTIRPDEREPEPEASAPGRSQ